jgi:hypothetical protein
MLGPRPPEGEEVSAGLEHPETFDPDLDGRDVVVPALPHESQPIRRVGHDGIYRVVRQGPEIVSTVP